MNRVHGFLNKDRSAILWGKKVQMIVEQLDILMKIKSKNLKFVHHSTYKKHFKINSSPKIKDETIKCLEEMEI